jgi:hypothetical protein
VRSMQAPLGTPYPPRFTSTPDSSVSSVHFLSLSSAAWFIVSISRDVQQRYEDAL